MVLEIKEREMSKLTATQPANKGAIVSQTDVLRTRRNEISATIRKEFGQNLAGLGVSLAYAIRLVEKHDLDHEETDAIIFARQKYGASLVNVDRWLKRGLTAGEIMKLYEIRQGFNENFGAGGERGGDLTISLSTIMQFVRTFPDMDLEEPVHLSEQLIEIFEALRLVFPFIKYPDTVLKMVLVAQRSLGCTEVGTAMEAVLDRRQWQDRNDSDKSRAYGQSWRHDSDEDDDC